MDGGFAARKCTIADLSDTGVRILVEAAETIPKNFRLQVSSAVDLVAHAK